MTIKEVEQQTGLQRSNIRFYEKEELVIPKRNAKNGYREYSDQDVENIKKIAYLRTLGISLDVIRRIMENEETLYTVIKGQEKVLDAQITDMEQAKVLCKTMLQDKDISFETLKVDRYLPEAETQWKVNSAVFRLDSVGFLYLWGGIVVWVILTALCLLAAVLTYGGLPPQIPVQWSGGKASSLAAKEFIFAYPAACILIRFLLRPFIWRRLAVHGFDSEMIVNYVINYLCFIVFSVETFTIFFIQGILSSIVPVLITDTAVFLGLLVIGWNRMETNKN